MKYYLQFNSSMSINDNKMNHLYNGGGRSNSKQKWPIYTSPIQSHSRYPTITCLHLSHLLPGTHCDGIKG